jgi:hypothetical protein
VRQLVLTILFCGAAFAQNQIHNAVLAWSEADAGTTFNVYRAPAACSTGPTFTKVATGLSVLTYTDTPLIAGQAYCYQVTAVIGTSESVASNQVQVVIAPFAPSLSGTAH